MPIDCLPDALQAPSTENGDGPRLLVSSSAPENAGTVPVLPPCPGDPVESSGGLSTGAIVGIVVGCVAAAASERWWQGGEEAEGEGGLRCAGQARTEEGVPQASRRSPRSSGL